MIYPLASIKKKRSYVNFATWPEIYGHRSEMARVKNTPIKSCGGKKVRKNLATKVSTKKNSTGGIGRPTRIRPGVLALREIRRYQKSTDLMIPKTAFSNLVRELANEYAGNVLRFSASAISALHECTEKHMVAIFENANLAANHCKRVTVTPKDFHLALRIAGNN